MEDDSRPVLVPAVATRMQSTTVGWRGNRRGHHGGTPECCLIYPLIQYRVSVNVGHRLFGSAWHRLGQRDVMALEGGVNLVWNSRKIAAVCWVCVTGPMVTCYERHEAMLPTASRMSMKLYMPCPIQRMLTSITSKISISRIYI